MNVVIVGSGPSGFYAAEALLASCSAVTVDILERLPVPFGLVRYGVAPDHQKLKQVTEVFTRLAADPRLRFLGNVEAGRDVSVEELTRIYSAVVIASGASADRRMGIENEDLPGSHSAVDFVGWYNGHPDHRHRAFDLSGEHAVIVGQGNVAIDVARILAKPVGLLAKTDIAPYALDALARSRVRTISIVGRRGPVQAKFTTKELRELGEIEGWDAVVDPAALALNEASAVELKDPRAVNTIKNFETFKQFAAKPRTNGGKEIRIEFCLSPLRIEGRDRAEAFVFERTELTGEATRQGMRATGELVRIPAGAVFRSIGYSGVPFPGLPFDAARNVVRNADGRVCDEQGRAVPGVYVTGWIKRGPTGIIGTNRVDSIATVKQLIADAPQPKDGASAQLQNLLSQRGVVWTTFSDWLAMDAFERDQGAAEGRVRKKLIGIDEMLSHASASSRATHSGARTPAEAATR